MVETNKNIKKLEEYAYQFIDDDDITDVYISKFIYEMIDTFKNIDERIKKLEKDNEIDLDNIKVGGND